MKTPNIWSFFCGKSPLPCLPGYPPLNESGDEYIVKVRYYYDFLTGSPPKDFQANILMLEERAQAYKHIRDNPPAALSDAEFLQFMEEALAIEFAIQLIYRDTAIIQNIPQEYRDERRAMIAAVSAQS